METQSTPATPVPAVTLPPSISIDARYWFAISIRSHHEKKVARYLAEREIEHFLPMYRTVHQWTNYRRAVLELPLFPGYLFIRIAPRERIRALELPGVLSLIGCGSTPLLSPRARLSLSAPDCTSAASSRTPAWSAAPELASSPGLSSEWKASS